MARQAAPIFSIARLLGLCPLQESNNMSDQEALDEFSFDIRWRYALDINKDDDYLSRRSLVEFRRRLAAKDPEMKLVRNVFDTIRDSALRKLEVSTKDQRLDSTHIISNIRIRGRTALFSDTLDVFLKSLGGDQLSIVPEDIWKWHTTESEGWFGLGPADQKVKLEELARYVYALITISIIWELGQFAPIINDVRMLGDHLLQARQDYPLKRLHELAKTIHPHPGQAAKRIREEVYSLLGIPICRS